MNSKVRRRKLATLFVEQCGLCHWCRKPMRRERPAIGETQPDDLATIEHLDSKPSGERGKHKGEKRIVLACRRCNWTRGNAENPNLRYRQKASPSPSPPARAEG